MAGLWCKAPSGFRFHHLETWVPSSRLPHDLRWLLERLQWSHSYPNTEWETWGGGKEKNEGEICVSCFSLLKELSWKSQVTTFFRTFFFFFLMWTIFKVFIEFVTILLLFPVLDFWLWGMWDLNSLTWCQTCTPCTGRRSPNRWTSREVANNFLISLLTAVAPHSSTPAWKIPWMEEPGGLQSMRLRRVRHDWATSLSLFAFMHWRRKWQPTPVFLPRESQGRGSQVGCHLWGRTESDTTEVT